MFRIGEGGARLKYGDAVVLMCLQALGLKSEVMKRIMELELPDIPSR